MKKNEEESSFALLEKFAFSKKTFLLKIVGKNSKDRKNYQKPQNHMKQQKSHKTLNKIIDLKI